MTLDYLYMLTRKKSQEWVERWFQFSCRLGLFFWTLQWFVVLAVIWLSWPIWLVMCCDLFSMINLFGFSSLNQKEQHLRDEDR